VTGLIPALSAPSESVLIGVRRLLDYGVADAGEAYKTLARLYPKADPVQLGLIVSHWLDATTPAEVDYVEQPVVVTRIAAGRLIDDEPLATLKVNPAETEREAERVAEG